MLRGSRVGGLGMPIFAAAARSASVPPPAAHVATVETPRLRWLRRRWGWRGAARLARLLQDPGRRGRGLPFSGAVVVGAAGAGVVGFVGRAPHAAVRRGCPWLWLPSRCGPSPCLVSRRLGRPRHLVKALGIRKVPLNGSPHDSANFDPGPAEPRAPHHPFMLQALEDITEQRAEALVQGNVLVRSARELDQPKSNAAASDAVAREHVGHAQELAQRHHRVKDVDGRCCRLRQAPAPAAQHAITGARTRLHHRRPASSRSFTVLSISKSSAITASTSPCTSSRTLAGQFVRAYRILYPAAQKGYQLLCSRAVTTAAGTTPSAASLPVYLPLEYTAAHTASP
eukprot:6208357-Pleurochrysis_carterae.AAC.1